jgi:hypothetical protein
LEQDKDYNQDKELGLGFRLVIKSFIKTGEFPVRHDTLRTFPAFGSHGKGHCD